MYGWIQQSIEALALEKFGADAWAKIKEEAGCADVPNGGFSRHEYYDDALTYRIVFAAASVLGIEPAAVLEAYGDYFITWMIRAGYGSFLRNQGQHMLQFLNVMDDMHRGLKEGLPRLVPPQLSCEAQDQDIVLTYVSTRMGLAPMMIGLIRGVGREVFASEYSAVITEQWTSSIEGHELHHTRYDICCIAGQPLSSAVGLSGLRRTQTQDMTISQMRVEAKNYSFFQENSVMASAWAGSLVQRVGMLATAEDAAGFACSFDIMELTSLMGTWTPQAHLALSGLFRSPFPDSSNSLPVPSLGYIHGAGGASGMRTKMYPTLAMTKAVTCGAYPLVRTSCGTGLRLVPVEVLVCVVPDPTKGGWLLRALVDTPNDDVVGSIAARAVLHAMSDTVRPRLVFNIAIDGLLLAVLTLFISDPDGGYRGWPFVAMALCKEVAEEGLQVRGYKERGWLRQKYLAGRGFVHGLHLVLYIYLLCSIGFLPRSTEEPSSNVALALFSCGQWWRFLMHMRGFETFGPKILPIIYTLKGMGPFALVMLVILLGFVYALLAMEASPDGFSVEPFIAIWQAGFLGVVSAHRESWYDVWFFVFSLVVALVMVNILIGVLSESYDVHQDNASIIFNREQAEMMLDVSLCLWPCKSFRPGLRWIQAVFCVECPDPGTEGPYLWACVPRDHVSSASRLANMKDHTAIQADSVKEAVSCQTGEVTQRLDEVLRRLEQIELCVRGSRMNDSHEGCPRKACL